MIDQRKKSRSLAFKNPMRLADEHAEMLTLLREVFDSGVRPALLSDETTSRARALIAEVDR